MPLVHSRPGLPALSGANVADDAELWRAARLLVDRYGDRAGAEAVARADTMQEIGDEEGTDV